LGVTGGAGYEKSYTQESMFLFPSFKRRGKKTAIRRRKFDFREEKEILQEKINYGLKCF